METGAFELSGIKRNDKRRAGINTRAQLLESRLALNPGLNLTRVSFSGVQKHFVG